MKVERDFGPAPIGQLGQLGVEYRWYATVEGKTYAYAVVVSEEAGRYFGVPIAVVEREAQREIARAIAKDLFGSRAL